MPDGGELTLSARNVDAAAAARFGLKGEFVGVALADRGVGMAPEIVKQAFDPFFTTKDRGHGTGLGLSQVYGFAQQSGGTALIESAPGHGTRITLLLPRSRGAHDGTASGVAGAVPAAYS
jgi:signal transduction histidine kinase